MPLNNLWIKASERTTFRRLLNDLRRMLYWSQKNLCMNKNRFYTISVNVFTPLYIRYYEIKSKNRKIVYYYFWVSQTKQILNSPTKTIFVIREKFRKERVKMKKIKKFFKPNF